jgi:hypothetical protein
MSDIRKMMTSCKQWLFGEKGVALMMFLVGAIFIAVGIHRFWVRPQHFGLASFLGCAVAAFGAFFLLLVTDYVLHHAPLVFIPWTISMIFFAIIQPHFGVGLGVALWYLCVTQLRN